MVAAVLRRRAGAAALYGRCLSGGIVLAALAITVLDACGALP